MFGNTVHTVLYQRHHGTKPRGHGTWVFRNIHNGHTVTIPSCTYTAARRQLPRGTWVVLPVSAPTTNEEDQ